MQYIFLFKGNNCYTNAPQCYMISALPVLSFKIKKLNKCLNFSSILLSVFFSIYRNLSKTLFNTGIRVSVNSKQMLQRRIRNNNKHSFNCATKCNQRILRSAIKHTKQENLLERATHLIGIIALK